MKYSFHFPSFQSTCHVSTVSSTFFIATDRKEKGSNFSLWTNSGPEITKKYFHRIHAYKSPATVVKWILNQSKCKFSTKKIFKGRIREFCLSMGDISSFKNCIRTLQSNLHFLPSFWSASICLCGVFPHLRHWHCFSLLIMYWNWNKNTIIRSYDTCILRVSDRISSCLLLKFIC